MSGIDEFVRYWFPEGLVMETCGQTLKRLRFEIALERYFECRDSNG